jgi:hypothetical protein
MHLTIKIQTRKITAKCSQGNINFPHSVPKGKGNILFFFDLSDQRERFRETRPHFLNYPTGGRKITIWQCNYHISKVLKITKLKNLIVKLPYIVKCLFTQVNTN